MKILVGNGQFFADGFAVRNCFFMEEGESRYLSYLSNRGCGAARVTLRSGRLSVSEGRIGVIRYDGGAELFPLPSRSDKAEKRFSVGGAPCLCAVSGERGEVRLSGAINQTYRTRCPLNAPTITLIEGQRLPILDLRATCDAGEYILMLSVGAEGTTLLLEDVGESVVTEQNEVRISRRYDDLALRTALTRYLWKGNGFDCSREIVCAKEQAFIREEMGRALLEATYAKDKTAIAALVSPEMGSAEEVMAYFGDILALRPAVFSLDPTAYTAVKRVNEEYLAITYAFTFDQRGRIANITGDEETLIR